jgi:hypothetical protein
METLSSVMNRLQKEGYNSEILQDEIQKLIPSEWLIDKIYRFEGMSNPEDNSILYAVSKTDGTRKSLVVNAYGVYNDSGINDFITKVEKIK